MANKILLKRSLTSGSVPTTGSLEPGEIALNVNDGLAFLRRSGSLGNDIVPLVSVGVPTSGSIISNVTGNLQGTASNAISASYALTASYALNSGGGGGGLAEAHIQARITWKI